MDLANAMVAEKVLPLPSAAIPTPASVKILGLFSKLTTVPRQPVSFRLSDDEVNQYLVYSLLSSPRPGLDSVRVKFFPHDYVSTFTVIDFDAVERWSPGLVPGFLGLTGKRALWIDVRFVLENRKISYKIEKAFYQDKSLPQWLAEKIIQTIGARQPENFGGNEMPAPLGLRRIQTGEHYVEAEN
jgi:hypothetical protein